MNSRFLNAAFLAILGLTADLSAHGTIRYVSPTGDDGNSGTSWAAPKRSVQAAVNIAASGDTVLVTNGVYALSSTIIITNAVVLASVNGPSVTILDGQQTVRVCGVPHAAATVNGFTIQNGRAVINGGGLYCNSGTILNCVIANNKATGNENGDGQGGGIYLAYGMVSNCVIFSNTVTSTNADSYNNTASGGGVYCYSGVVSDCVISNNVCTANYGSGGGVTLNGGELTHSQLANNSVVALWYADGGGVYADMNGSGYSFVDRCTLISNSVTATETGAYTTCLAEGGGFYISNATDFRDSLITGNKAASPFGFADGGGGRSVGSLVRNCTVVMNQASAPSNPSQGGGMQWGGTDQPVNDIVVFNSSSSLPNNSYVNPLNPPTFIDCFFADPSFVNPMIGDFHLQDTSPCINAGTNQSWMIGAQDLDGNNRIGGGTVDIGAYEHSSLTPTLANARQSGNQIILSWPTNATGFTLQSSTALSGPVVWSSGFSPVTVGSNFVVSNTIATGTRFYRLKK